MKIKDMKDKASLMQRYNPKLIRDIRKAQKEFKAGKGIPWETAKKQLGYRPGLKSSP